MKSTNTKIVHPLNDNKNDMVDAGDNNEHDTAVVSEFMNRNDMEATEVQNFFGYAINELIYETMTHAKQEKLENWYMTTIYLLKSTIVTGLQKVVSAT